MIVIDASVALSWCFADESTAEGDAILDRVKLEGARVPSLWHLEVGNALWQAERRKRISEAEVSQRLELLAALPILTDAGTPQRAWGPALALARQHNLTVYDAAYLELATRLGVTLASKDKALLEAARVSGAQTVTC